jgi:hypothetical protein
MQGRAGRALAVGATRVASGSGIRRISTQALPYGAISVSLDGGAATGAGKKTAQSAPLILATRSGRLIKSPAPTSSGRSSTALPSPAPAAAGSATASRSAQRSALSSTADSSSVESATLQTTAATSAASATAASSTTPKCSVGRNEENRQVMQPGTAQVSWAVQMAEQGLLTGSSYQRAANYANLGLVAYAPNDDFSKVALKHPSSDTWDSVPRSVYEAIVAQESNYSQASWHALPGISGGALVGDYYGAGGSISHMDYSKGDCGYGLGQITSGMSKGDTSYSVNGQTKIGVDYQENVAAPAPAARATGASAGPTTPATRTTRRPARPT